jgi:predicted flap endonuclease-1-like 5' DNA nuclease
MAFLMQASLDSDAGAQALPGGPDSSPRAAPPTPAMSLHISKLRGITYPVRQRLKRQGITYTHQLIAAAQDRRSCRSLAALCGIEEAVLERLVRRADLARINGVGAIFADMLELLGIDQSRLLAGQDPVALHAALAELNAAEQLARRAPTPEEVQSWVAQARALMQAQTSGLADAVASGSS